MPDTTAVNSSSPSTIAWRRGLETTIIVVLVSAVLVVLPQLQGELARCAAPAGTVSNVPCVINWAGIFYGFLAAVISGAINGLTAFMSATHNVAANAAAPQTIIAQTDEKNPVPVVGATLGTNPNTGNPL